MLERFVHIEDEPGLKNFHEDHLKIAEHFDLDHKTLEDTVQYGSIILARYVTLKKVLAQMPGYQPVDPYPEFCRDQLFNKPVVTNFKEARKVYEASPESTRVEFMWPGNIWNNTFMDTYKGDSPELIPVDTPVYLFTNVVVPDGYLTFFIIGEDMQYNGDVSDECYDLVYDIERAMPKDMYVYSIRLATILNEETGEIEEAGVSRINDILLETWVMRAALDSMIASNFVDAGWDRVWDDVVANQRIRIDLNL